MTKVEFRTLEMSLQWKLYLNQIYDKSFSKPNQLVQYPTPQSPYSVFASRADSSGFLGDSEFLTGLGLFSFFGDFLCEDSCLLFGLLLLDRDLLSKGQRLIFDSLKLNKLQVH